MIKTVEKATSKQHFYIICAFTPDGRMGAEEDCATEDTDFYLFSDCYTSLYSRKNTSFFLWVLHPADDALVHSTRSGTRRPYTVRPIRTGPGDTGYIAAIRFHRLSQGIAGTNNIFLAGRGRIWRSLKRRHMLMKKRFTGAPRNSTTSFSR